jgi:HD-GYP domain-containing protein (c-di-GMP phosphodiesterase class II)
VTKVPAVVATEVPAEVATKVPIEVEPVDIGGQAREVIEQCLHVARERLAMQIAWVAEFAGDREIVRIVEGDKDDWGVYEDDSLPLAQSYCRRMLTGEIPNAIPDTAREPAVASLGVTHAFRIGSYIGVPIILPGGGLRGAFCCARHTPNANLDDRDVRFMQVLAHVVANEIAFRETLAHTRHLEQQASSADALLAALAARDDYTGEHSRAVVDLVDVVGKRLHLSDVGLLDLRHVARLHDIGKVGIPDAILRKRGTLTDAERETMRAHPAIGAQIVAAIAPLAHLAPAIRAEHEQWNGGGYPDGLVGYAIPIESRITFVCDSYHAMVSDRPYRLALTEEHALAELRRCSGAMFWPDAARALIEELTSSGLALAKVSASNSDGRVLQTLS